MENGQARVGCVHLSSEKLEKREYLPSNKINERAKAAQKKPIRAWQRVNNQNTLSNLEAYLGAYGQPACAPGLINFPARQSCSDRFFRNL